MTYIQDLGVHNLKTFDYKYDINVQLYPYELNKKEYFDNNIYIYFNFINLVAKKPLIETSSPFIHIYIYIYIWAKSSKSYHLGQKMNFIKLFGVLYGWKAYNL